MSEVRQGISLLNPVSLLWAGITLMSVYLSRPILNGWFNDPTLRFGLVTFLLWLSAVVLQWRRFPANWPRMNTVLVVFASGLLCLGIAGELQAFIYVASAILLTLPMQGPVIKYLQFIACSCLWMPALAWLLTPLAGFLLPWITLCIATTLLIYSLSLALIHYASKTSHRSI